MFNSGNVSETLRLGFFENSAHFVFYTIDYPFGLDASTPGGQADAQAISFFLWTALL